MFLVLLCAVEEECWIELHFSCSFMSGK